MHVLDRVCCCSKPLLALSKTNSTNSFANKCDNSNYPSRCRSSRPFHSLFLSLSFPLSLSSGPIPKVPYRKIVIEFFNIVFGAAHESHSWWKDQLPSLLRTFFGINWYPFSSNENADQDWRAEIFSLSGKGREIFFKRIGNAFPFTHFDGLFTHPLTPFVQ